LTPEVPPATPSKTPTGAANATADRAIEILLLFTEQAPIWSAPELAAHFDMPRSTIYRYLGSLRSHALIVQDSRGSYALGPRLLQMAQVAKAVNPVIGVAVPRMRELAERFKENVVLNECIGTDIMPLERIQSPHHIVLKSSRTHMLPWPATGSAKVFLAFASDAERSRILTTLTPTAYTEHTIATLAELEEHLRQVKAQGHAVSDEERDEGVWGASVPVFDQHGCRYAISVLGPKFRIPKGTRAEIIKALEQASQAISQDLR
jgi:DNA-binding IclR family transcriptional regulator